MSVDELWSLHEEIGTYVAINEIGRSEAVVLERRWFNLTGTRATKCASTVSKVRPNIGIRRGPPRLGLVEENGRAG